MKKLEDEFVWAFAKSPVSVVLKGGLSFLNLSFSSMKNSSPLKRRLLARYISIYHKKKTQ